jgi:hypothetical protein
LHLLLRLGVGKTERFNDFWYKIFALPWRSSVFSSFLRKRKKTARRQALGQASNRGVFSACHGEIVSPGLGMSLAGGGVPVEDLSQGCPEADWGMMLGDMFWECH